MINRIIKVMWPTLTQAIMKEVLVQVKVQLEAQVFKKVGFQDACSCGMLRAGIVVIVKGMVA